MATWYAQAAGNASAIQWKDIGGNVKTWPPDATVTLNTNSKAVVLDQDVTVQKLQGGGAAFTILNTLFSITINGDVAGDTSRCLDITGATLVWINGSVKGGDMTVTSYGIYVNASGADIRISGNVDAYASAGIYTSGGQSVINIAVGGYVKGGSALGGYGGIVLNTTGAGGGIVTVTGDVEGGTNSMGIYSSASNSIIAYEVRGTIKTNTTQPGLYTASGTNTFLLNNIEAQANAGTSAFNNIATVAGLPASIKGNIINQLIQNAISCKWKRVPNATNSNYYTCFDSTGTAIKMCPQLPAGKVLKGVTHGDLTGTLARRVL